VQPNRPPRVLSIEHDKKEHIIQHLKKFKTMKTLVLSALLGATLTTASAHINPPAAATETTVAKDRKTEELKTQIGLLQWNVDIVWDQYERATDSDLLAQMNSLISYYQDDIDQGIRISDSKNAIAEIREMYSSKIEKQRKAETKQIAKLQTLLQAKLRKEEKTFNKLKRTHADQINAQTEPLVRATERQFAQSSARIIALKGTAALAAL
jgi:predicted  nucleic acid-binding Zn-ribbon protein